MLAGEIPGKRCQNYCDFDKTSKESEPGIRLNYPDLKDRGGTFLKCIPERVTGFLACWMLMWLTHIRKYEREE